MKPLYEFTTTTRAHGHVTWWFNYDAPGAPVRPPLTRWQQIVEYLAVLFR